MDPLDELVYEQMLLQRHAVHRTDPYGHEAHLDRSATLLLARLVDQGPMTVSQLSQAFGLDISTVHRQLASAMKHGLIEKFREPDAGAAWLHKPTDEGRARLSNELRARHQSFGKVTADWDEADVRAFADLMRRFNECIETQRRQHWPRKP